MKTLIEPRLLFDIKTLKTVQTRIQSRWKNARLGFRRRTLHFVAGKIPRSRRSNSPEEERERERKDYKQGKENGRGWWRERDERERERGRRA